MLSYGIASLGLGLRRPGLHGKQTANDAAEHGIQLAVFKLDEAKRGFVLLPRRWVVECSFPWAARFRRLADDDERLPEADQHRGQGPPRSPQTPPYVCNHLLARGRERVHSAEAAGPHLAVYDARLRGHDDG